MSDSLADLPEALRNRIIALTAGVLPVLTPLPASLRRIAAFAPSRRARAGAGAIATELGDHAFRERVGIQIAVRPVGTDRLDAAAAAWLTRAQGWTELVSELEPMPSEDPRLTKLQERLEVMERTAREARAKAKAQVEELKADNVTLRRKLGEIRVTERRGREEVVAGQEALRDMSARIEALTVAKDQEIRRLRATIEKLENERAALRRTGRAERDEASVRARLLLDTVIDAASGLRQQLALPAVAETPGSRVEGELALSESAPAGILGPGDASLIEQVLSLPRARLIIDGYNVSMNAWETATLETQRSRLLAAVAGVVARTGAETTVVFDAHSIEARPSARAPRGVRVVFSPYGVIADDVIRDLVAAEPPGRPIVVVSSDAELGARVRAVGGRVASAAALIRVIS